MLLNLQVEGYISVQFEIFYVELIHMGDFSGASSLAAYGGKE